MTTETASPWKLRGVPAFLSDYVEQPESLLVVHYAFPDCGVTYSNDTTLFAVANPRVTFSREKRKLSVKTLHSFACDEEGSASRLFVAEVDYADVDSVFNNTTVFTGSLRTLQAYDPSQPTPFTGKERKNESEEYYANWGYPYLPPRVTVEQNNEGEKLTGNVPVTAVLYTKVSDNLYADVLGQCTN